MLRRAPLVASPLAVSPTARQAPRLGRRTVKAVVAVGVGYGVWMATDRDPEPRWRRQTRLYGTSALRFFKTLGAAVATLTDYKYTFFMQDNWMLFNKEPMPSDYLAKCHTRAGTRIAQTALANGGMYIKLGQTVGSLNNVLPDEYLEALRVLQDCAYPRGWEEVERTIRDEFGLAPQELFARFDKQPVGAASLAQVHHAVTKDGKDVAVKVQYADLRDRFEGDLATLRFMLDLVTFVFPKFEFGWILSDFQDTLRLEMDFLNEAKNARRCADDLRDIHNVTVPVIYDQYTTERVLTTEFIYGCKANDIKSMKNMGIDVAKVCHLIIKTFATQIFETGFVHSDPHPGNVFVRKNARNEPEVVLLDHGLYIEVSPEDRRNFSEFWTSLVLGDDKRLKEISAKLGVANHTLFAAMMMQRPYVAPDAAATRPNKRFGIQLSLSKEDIDRMRETARDRMDEMVTVLKTMPRSLILVIRNLNLIRSLNRELGAPVNRFTLMARTALESQVKEFSFWRRIIFEIRLQWINVRNWLLDTYLSYQRYRGVIPKEFEEFVMPA